MVALAYQFYEENIAANDNFARVECVAQIESGTVTYIHFCCVSPFPKSLSTFWGSRPDKQNSVVALTNSSGAAVSRRGYGTYGETNPTQMAETTHPFGYTGRRWESELGLYYYRARWYDPELGTFLQTDPIGSLDYINLYSYVGLNPMNATDPTGLAGCADQQDQDLEGECIDASNFTKVDKPGGFLGIGKTRANDFAKDAIGSKSTDAAASKYAKEVNQVSGTERGASLGKLKSSNETGSEQITERTPVSAEEDEASFLKSDVADGEAFIHTHPTEKRKSLQEMATGLSQHKSAFQII